MNCIHCEERIAPTQPVHRYASGPTAHLGCVSQVNHREMDEYLAIVATIKNRFVHRVAPKSGW